MFHAFFGSFADFFIFENLPFPGKNPVERKDSEDIYRKVPERGTAGDALCNIIFIAFFVSIFLFFTYKNPTGKAEESTQNPPPETADNAPAGKQVGAGEKSASESRRKRPENRRCNLRRREKTGAKQARRGRKNSSGNPFKTVKTAAGKSEKETENNSGFRKKRENAPAQHTRQSQKKQAKDRRPYPNLSYLSMDAPFSPRIP